MAGFEEISRVKHRKVGRRVLLNLVARGDELLKAMAPGVTGQNANMAASFWLALQGAVRCSFSITRLKYRTPPPTKCKVALIHPFTQLCATICLVE